MTRPTSADSSSTSHVVGADALIANFFILTVPLISVISFIYTYVYINQRNHGLQVRNNTFPRNTLTDIFTDTLITIPKQALYPPEKSTRKQALHHHNEKESSINQPIAHQLYPLSGWRPPFRRKLRDYAG